MQLLYGIKNRKEGNHFQDIGLEGSMILKCTLNIMSYACVYVIKFVIILYVISAMPFSVSPRA